MEKKTARFQQDHKIDFGREKMTLLYEDDYIAVIYKPCGMLSVPYPGSRSRTAVETLEQIMRKKGTFSKNRRPFAVHRLDRDTSGVMMLALTKNAQKKIMDNWQTFVTGRLYRAVAENPQNPADALPDSGMIDDEIAYNARNIGFVPKKGGSPQFRTVSARTHYRIIARGKTHTLFELSLDTGRKNQIRVHLSSKGYPLAGDDNYRAKTNPFGRLALHARTLEFTHPFTGEKKRFEIPEPPEWQQFVKYKFKYTVCLS